tara:strand:+ start:1779 stop:2723 length:945 start_codon:yes stop_codon:yes gene_type:complete
MTTCLTNHILMIRPSKFGYNNETALNNTYQNIDDTQSDIDISLRAKNEFDNLVNALKKHNINVLVFNDTLDTCTPDSLFPNNWISTHASGVICLYPMFAQNRRLERRDDIVKYLIDNFQVKKVVDELVIYEDEERFLEGTGSMVLDRYNNIAYAAISNRTNEMVFNLWCSKFNYDPVSFHTQMSLNGQVKPVYHTNVLMSICSNMVFICFDVCSYEDDKEKLLNYFNKTNKEVIEISIEQKKCFLGNVIEIKNNQDETYLVMSTKAFSTLNDSQIQIIHKYSKIIHSPLDTIEYFGGGGARCMIAELYLKKKLL